MSACSEALLQLRSLLDDADAAAYSDDLLTHCLRNALDELSAACPALCQADLTAAADGPDQCLTGLPQDARILQVFYPGAPQPVICSAWSAGCLDNAVTLRFTRASLQAGEAFSLLYACRHTLEGLDGAIATSLTPAALELLGNMAAAYAVLARALQLSTAGGLPLTTLAALRELSADLRALYLRAAAAFTPLPVPPLPPAGFHLEG